MQNDIFFDNIYIGYFVEDVEKFVEEIFKVKYFIEKVFFDVEKFKKKDSFVFFNDFKFFDDLVLYVKEKFDFFFIIVQNDFIEVIKFVFEVVVGIGVIVVFVIVFIVSLIGFGFLFFVVQKVVSDVKDKVKEVKDKVVQVMVIGVEKVKVEVMKCIICSQIQRLWII